MHINVHNSQRSDVSQRVHMYIPDIEIVPRRDRARLGVFRTSRSRKPIKTTDRISDYGIKRSQYTRSDDYGFDQIIFYKFSFYEIF